MSNGEWKSIPICEWVDTKTKQGHPIFGQFLASTGKEPFKYVRLSDYEQLETELNEARELFQEHQKYLENCSEFFPKELYIKTQIWLERNK